MKNTLTAAERKLAIDSLKVRREMMKDCMNITSGSRHEYYRNEVSKIEAELAEIEGPAQKLATPIDIAVPLQGIMDHGLTLVHEIGGKPRNYLHEVSVERWEQDAIRYLNDAGYAQKSGWVRDGKQYWLYSKPFPLSVEKWCA